MTLNRASLTVSDYDNKDIEKEYRFSKIFSDEADQKTVFNNTMVNMLKDVFHKAKGGLVFSYGNSGSGKTFTMIGNENVEDFGIIPRTANFILKLKKELEKQKNPFRPSDVVNKPIGNNDDPSSKFKFMIDDYEVDTTLRETDLKIKDIGLSISAYEIYKQNVYDLNTDKFIPLSKRKKIKVATLKDRSVLYNLNKEIDISEPEELKELLLKLQENRSKASTLENKFSSRSHAVY